MSNAKKFDPDKIIDYKMDYYAILGLEKGCLPPGINKKEKEEISDILAKAFRKYVRFAHPDMPGGSEEKFKILVRAHTILGDPLLRRIYDSGGKDRPQFLGDENPFEINWDTVGTYREGTQDDTVGFSLFLTLSQRAEELNIVPSFFPERPDHNYEWDWTLPDKDVKLALSLVRDEEEVLRLTSKEALEKDSLPFKIFFCIPRAACRFLYGAKEEYVHEDGTVDVLKGKIQGAQYSDFNLFETTVLKEAQEYIAKGGMLESHLESFRSGEMLEMQKKLDKQANQLKWANTGQIKNLDIELLKTILTAKSIKFEAVNPKAADFIDDIPDD